MRVRAAFLVPVLLALPLGYCGYRWHVYTSEFDWNRIPKQLEVGNKSYGHRGTACHLLVFKMSNGALARLRREGLKFFDRPMTVEHRHWARWKETPRPLAENELPYCAGSGSGADLETQEAVTAMNEFEQSLKNPGSYVSGSFPYILVVNPETGSVIFGGND